MSKIDARKRKTVSTGEDRVPKQYSTGEGEIRPVKMDDDRILAQKKKEKHRNPPGDIEKNKVIQVTRAAKTESRQARHRVINEELGRNGMQRSVPLTIKVMSPCSKKEITSTPLVLA